MTKVIIDIVNHKSDSTCTREYTSFSVGDMDDEVAEVKFKSVKRYAADIKLTASDIFSIVPDSVHCFNPDVTYAQLRRDQLLYNAGLYEFDGQIYKTEKVKFLRLLEDSITSFTSEHMPRSKPLGDFIDWRFQVGEMPPGSYFTRDGGK